MALKLNPSIAEAWYNEGQTFKALGRTTEAEAAFANAKELGHTS
jgi:cytochrome c-type biogenesis protein CcmH/NrfG